MVNLAFDEKPDYEKCRIILREGLKAKGYRDDGKLVFMSATPVPVSRKPKSRLDRKVRKRDSTEMEDEEEQEDEEDLSEKKPKRSGAKRARGASKRGRGASSRSGSSTRESSPVSEKENTSKKANVRVGGRGRGRSGSRGRGRGVVKDVPDIPKYEGISNPTPQMLALMNKKR